MNPVEFPLPFELDQTVPSPTGHFEDNGVSGFSPDSSWTGRQPFKIQSKRECGCNPIGR